MNAGGAKLSGSELLLTDVDDEIFGFTDRPDRQHASFTWREIVEMWSQNTDSFAANPPNAVIRGTSATNPGVGCAVEIELMAAPLIGEDGTRLRVELLYEWQGTTTDCDVLSGVTVFVDSLSVREKKAECQPKEPTTSGTIRCTEASCCDIMLAGYHLDVTVECPRQGECSAFNADTSNVTVHCGQGVCSAGGSVTYGKSTVYCNDSKYCSAGATGDYARAAVYCGSGPCECSVYGSDAACDMTCPAGTTQTITRGYADAYSKDVELPRQTGQFG